MKKIIALTFFALFISFSVHAQLKIGYTNPEFILAQLDETRDVNEQITSMIAEKDSLLAIEAGKIQQDLEAYEAQKANLSLEEQEAQEESLLQRDEDFRNMRQQSLNEVQQRRIALLAPIENRIFQTIDEVAKSLELDLVLNEGSLNSGAIIFYASENQINITEQVLEKLKS